jgi:hypothetical protein
MLLIHHREGDGQGGVDAWRFILKAARHLDGPLIIIIGQLAEDSFQIEIRHGPRSLSRLLPGVALFTVTGATDFPKP